MSCRVVQGPITNGLERFKWYEDDEERRSIEGEKMLLFCSKSLEVTACVRHCDSRVFVAALWWYLSCPLFTVTSSDAYSATLVGGALTIAEKFGKHQLLQSKMMSR